MTLRHIHLLGTAVLITLLALNGCYSSRAPEGGGEASFKPPRQINAGDVAVPPGYAIEVVARGLTFPSAVVLDDQDRPFVIEAGYSYGPEFAVPRLLQVLADGKTHELARGTAGPWTGASFHDGRFYVSETADEGRILAIRTDGNTRVLAAGLPGRADHHTNRPVVGPDGWLYFAQGTATNSGIVGKDNHEFGWLSEHPEWHDIPCRDITLTGLNFATDNLMQPDSKDRVRTGAFVPYGTQTTKGQVIPGRVPCSGAVMRVPLEGGQPELVAWGFRNPFGLAFAPDGRLFLTENGFDARGSRQVFGAADFLWEVKPGLWYGWPDFSGGQPINDTHFKPPGRPKLEPLLSPHPGTPPRPSAVLGVHSSSNGLDFSRNPAFGYQGEAFIAQFGDMVPKTGKVLSPVGFQVVRVDPRTGVIRPFAINKGKKNGPASYLGKAGLERPVDLRFSQDGDTLYILDFGVMTVSEEGLQPVKETGVLWRIRRSASTEGKGP